MIRRPISAWPCGPRCRESSSRMITKQQYRRLMNRYQATGNVTERRDESGDVSRPGGAASVLEAGQPTAELQAKRTWRTRPDPLAGIYLQGDLHAAGGSGAGGQGVVRAFVVAAAPWEVGQKHLRTFGGSSNGGCSMGRTRRCFLCRTGFLGARYGWTGPTPTSWGSRLKIGPSRTCFATRCCRTRTGNGPRGVNRSPCSRCVTGCRKGSSAWAG